MVAVHLYNNNNNENISIKQEFKLHEHGNDILARSKYIFVKALVEF